MASRKSWRRAVAPHSPHQRAANHATRTGMRSNQGQSILPLVISDNALYVAMAALLAKPVVLTTTDGSVYEGLFGGTDRPDRSLNKPTLHILLRYAHVVVASTKSAASLVSQDEQRGRTIRKLRVPVAAVSSLRATTPDFASIAPVHTQRTADTQNVRSFATDTEISRGSTNSARPLQRFENYTEAIPSETAPPSKSNVTLDEQTFGALASPVNSTGTQKWDQFQVNESKFGVTTTFDENEYTTKLERGSADFAQREREAARIASEIESSSTDNIHQQEERNQTAPDDGRDEEDRYSGVQRPVQSNQDVRSTSETPAKQPRSLTADRPRLSYAAAAAGGNNRASTAAKPLQPGKFSKSRTSSVQSSSTSSVGQGPSRSTSRTANQNPTNPQPHPQPFSQPHSEPQTQSQCENQSQSQTQSQNKSLSQPQTQSSAAVQAQSQKPTVNRSQSVQTSSSAPLTSQQRTSLPPKSSLPPKAPSGKLQVNGQVHSGNKQASITKTLSTSSRATGTSTQKTGPKSTTSVMKDKDIPEKNGKIPQKESSGHESLPSIMKVRTTLTGRGSPNQTRNSPLPTPVKTDTSAIRVLNLDAETPNLGPEQIKKFQEYKANREMQSITENREKITDGLKKFSTEFNGSLRRGLGSGSTSAASSSTSLINPSYTADEKQGEELKNADESNARPLDVDLSTSKVVDKTEKVDTEKPQSHQKPIQKSSEDAEPSETSITAINDVSTKTAISKSVESKPKMKGKSKLNPNAAEFDPNAFKSSARKPVASASVQQPTSYGPMTGGMEFSQPIPTMPQSGYPMQMQPIPQFPYGQPYTMMVPAAMPATIPGGGGIQYMQGPAVSIPVGQVPGRFPQSFAMPVSYGYPPVTPMVIAQPAQRMPPGSPYQFYNPQFAGTQNAASPMSGIQQSVYPQHGGSHGGGGMHLQNGRSVGGGLGNNGSVNGIPGSSGNIVSGVVDGGANGASGSGGTGSISGNRDANMGGSGAASGNPGSGGNNNNTMGMAGGRGGGHGGTGRRGGMGRSRGRQHGHHNAQHNVNQTGPHHNGPHHNGPHHGHHGGSHTGQLGAHGQSNTNLDRGGPKSPEVGIADSDGDIGQK